MLAAQETASCFRAMPGPEEPVMALAPVRAAPTQAQMEAISSSIWRKVPSTWGSRSLMRSAISFWGVMG